MERVKGLAITAVLVLIRGCAAHVPMRVWKHVWVDAKEPVDWLAMVLALVLQPIKHRQNQSANETPADVGVINIRTIQLKANKLWKENQLVK